MNRRGRPVLCFQTPALVDGLLTYFDGMRYRERVVALCFLPYAGLVAPELIDRTAQQFALCDVTLLIVASGVRPLHRLWSDLAVKPTTPVLADLCGRLHRQFDVAAADSMQRCQTFVIDIEGVLRLRVSHDFIERDLILLKELLDTARRVPMPTDYADSGAPCASRGAGAIAGRRV